MSKIKKNNNSLNAMILSGMRFLTLFVNMFSSAILARSLDMESFGTYASGNLVISIFTTMTILGLMDAANFFFNKSEKSREDYVNTIFFIQITVGIVCAAIILILQDYISDYFNNPLMHGLYIYIAFRPLLNNTENVLVTLQISIGKARAVAARKAAIALSKLVVIIITSVVTKDIRTIFAAYLVMDTVGNLYYFYNFKKSAFTINPFKFKSKLFMPILKFAIPMGIYVLTNTLSREMDKLVIGRYEGAADLAVYSNCGAPLPFDIITAAVMTIIIPIMTQLIHKNKLENARRLLKTYISIGILTTVVFTTACIILSREIIELLYGPSYLVGQVIFILYTFVDMIKFANISLVLSAKGWTKKLMMISFAMLGGNAVLNMVLYYTVGFVGPAIATVIITFASTLVLMSISAKILGTNILGIFDWKLIFRMVISIAALGTLSALLRTFMFNRGVHYFFIIAVVGFTFVVGMAVVNLKQIKNAFKMLNKEKSDFVAADEKAD